MKKCRKKTPKRRIECFLCKIEMETMKKLRIHMRCHNRDNICDICQMNLTGKELKLHLCGEEKSIRCDYCTDEFNVTAKLLKHLETHTQRKFYRCESCPKFFASITLKEHHLKSHSNQDALREFVCEICSKTYSSKFHLDLHKKRHELGRCKYPLSEDVSAIFLIINILFQLISAKNVAKVLRTNRA